MDQGERSTQRTRGRPRKWPSEAARREHEAAKRRLGNKTQLSADEFNDIVRMTALADELRQQVDALTDERDELSRQLERVRRDQERLEKVVRSSWRDRGATDDAQGRPVLPAPAEGTPLDAPAEPVPPPLNRQQRRAADRNAKRRQSGRP